MQSFFRVQSLLRHVTVPASTFQQTVRHVSAAYPVIPICPSPSCPCADMPQDLDIERSIDLNGTMAPYNKHLLISSGKDDWQSKIEDERQTAPWGEFTANVKSALGPKGKFHDPYHNVVVTTASFSPPDYEANSQKSRALLFPSFQMVDEVPTKADDIADFVRTFLLPHNLHPSYDQLSEEEKQGKRRDISNLTSKYWAGKVHPITSPTILICSHHTRDSRCGVLGPLLHAEFTQYINKRHSLRNAATDQELTDRHRTSNKSPVTFASHPEFVPDVVDRHDPLRQPVNVGMISHIGGHKFAGNVIVYIPPDYHCQPLERQARGAAPKDQVKSDNVADVSEVIAPREGEPLHDLVEAGLSPLAGKGIWYGRVEPRYVEGIVEQTIGHGNIIRELFRGGVNQDGSSIRLPLY